MVSTVDESGRPNFAPMGILLEGQRVLLRPFRDARTWANLKQVGEGVINITDDVLIFARCAMTSEITPNRPAREVRACILQDVCSWKEFVIESKDLTEDRGRFWGRIVASGRGREFSGLNRAKHAVIEATILASRVFLLGRERVLDEVQRLRPLVEKTGGDAEREAFTFVVDRIREGRDED
jgi:hypothetical protein